MIFSIAIAAALVMATPATPTPEYLVDRIVCPRTKGGPDTNPSAETVWRWEQTLPYDNDYYNKAPNTPTRAVDPIVGSFERLAVIHGNSGGGGGIIAFVDPQKRAYAYCSQGDAVNSIGVYEDVRVPFTMPHARASAIHFRSGLGLGSSLAAVRHVYGPARLQPLKNSLAVLIYSRETGHRATRDNPINSIHAENTMFWFRNGRVVGFYRITGY